MSKESNVKKNGRKKGMPDSVKSGGAAVYFIAAAIVALSVFGAYQLFRPESPSLVADMKPAPINGSFLTTVPNDFKPLSEAPAGMVWIPGGEFSMGNSDPRGAEHGGHDPMADTRPVHRVYVDGFWMDSTEVTNAQFEEFARATGYITVAEKPPLAEDFPGVPAEKLVAGSVVFTPPDSSVPLDNHYQWWSYIHGADWRHPAGPGGGLTGKEKFPVVHISYEDAVAYCNWADKRLPTEAEWEFAARGGFSGKLYPWGDELNPASEWMANTFQGGFPNNETPEDGYDGAAPVARFKPNGYGLYDISGNVWEWVSDWYRPDYYADLDETGVVARNPSGPESPFDPSEPGVMKRVHRGGSFLCTEEYCTRYMVGTRGKGEVSTGTNHLGFRCVMEPQKTGG